MNGGEAGSVAGGGSVAEGGSMAGGGSVAGGSSVMWCGVVDGGIVHGDDVMEGIGMAESKGVSASVLKSFTDGASSGTSLSSSELFFLLIGDDVIDASTEDVVIVTCRSG